VNAVKGLSISEPGAAGRRNGSDQALPEETLDGRGAAAPFLEFRIPVVSKTLRSPSNNDVRQQSKKAMHMGRRVVSFSLLSSLDMAIRLPDRPGERAIVCTSILTVYGDGHRDVPTVSVAVGTG
jgi:hypothetical protein